MSACPPERVRFFGMARTTVERPFRRASTYTI